MHDLKWLAALIVVWIGTGCLDQYFMNQCQADNNQAAAAYEVMRDFDGSDPVDDGKPQPFEPEVCE